MLLFLNIFSEALKAIAENSPYALYLFIFVAALYAVWMIAKLYFIRFKNVEDKANEIPKIGEKIDLLNNKIDDLKSSFNEKIDNIEKILISITTYLKTKDPKSPDFWSERSPIQLTEFSREVIEKSGGRIFVDLHIDALGKKIEKKGPKGLYDIQDFAYSVIYDFVDTEAFNKIKDFIYHNPVYRHWDMNISLIIQAMAVYLRDKYLEKNPEFTRIFSSS